MSWWVLRHGSVFVITTPFLIKHHPAPLDLWHWTATGLRALPGDTGFASISAHVWGNRACVVGNFDTLARLRARHPFAGERTRVPDRRLGICPSRSRDRCIAYGDAARKLIGRMLGARVSEWESAVRFYGRCTSSIM
jgi:hypothetical protein